MKRYLRNSVMQNIKYSRRCIVKLKKKRKRSYSVPWQQPLHPKKNSQSNVTEQIRHQNPCWNNDSSADPEGGGGLDPLRFVRGGVLCRGLMGRRGVNSCFYLIIIIFFWLASLASILYNRISTCIHTSKFNVQYGTVTLSLYFPYPNHEKIPTSHPLVAFIKGHFHIYLASKYTILHQFSQSFSWGGIPKPPPRHIYNIKTTMSSVCLWRDQRLASVQKAMPYWK